MLKVRKQRRRDIPDVVKLYNEMVKTGGYALTEPEFNRRINAQDWLDWSEKYEYAVRLVIENKGKFHGFCVFKEVDEGEIELHHFGIWNKKRKGPGMDVVWVIFRWLKNNTNFKVAMVSRSELTNRSEADEQARAAGSERVSDDIWRVNIADAVKMEPKPKKRKTR